MPPDHSPTGDGIRPDPMTAAERHEEELHQRAVGDSVRMTTSGRMLPSARYPELQALVAEARQRADRILNEAEPARPGWHEHQADTTSLASAVMALCSAVEMLAAAPGSLPDGSEVG